MGNLFAKPEKPAAITSKPLPQTVAPAVRVVAPTEPPIPLARLAPVPRAVPVFEIVDPLALLTSKPATAASPANQGKLAPRPVRGPRRLGPLPNNPITLWDRPQVAIAPPNIFSDPTPAMPAVKIPPSIPAVKIPPSIPSVRVPETKEINDPMRIVRRPLAQLLRILTEQEQQPRPLDPALGKMEAIGRYDPRLYDSSKSIVLGKGSFGQVSRQTLKSNGKTVIVKRLIKNAPGAYDDLQREVYVLSVIHPKCAEFLLCVEEVQQDRDYYYLILRYDGFVTLDQLSKMQGNQSLWRNSTAMGLAILNLYRGLNTLHALGVAHRDIKPANILVNLDGRIRYIDFGVSCLRTDASKPDMMCSNMQLSGTPYYLAPELGIGAPHFSFEQYVKADYWALGLTVMYCFLRQTVAELWIRKRGLRLDQRGLLLFKAQFNYQSGKDALHVEIAGIEDRCRKLGALVGSSQTLSPGTLLVRVPKQRQLPMLE